MSSIAHTGNNITFGILSYSFVELTITCIDSLRKYEPSSPIIVLDNNSPDQAGFKLQKKYAQDPDITIVLEAENLGVAKGRNTLSQQVTTDIVVFIDNDAYITAPVHTVITQALSQPTVGACGLPRLLDPTLRPYDQNTPTRQVDAIGGAFFAIRTKTFQQEGRFDEQFGIYGYEDIELGLRLKSRGYTIIGLDEPELPVVHVEHHSSSLLTNMDELEQKTKKLLQGKWGHREDLLEINRQHIKKLTCRKCEDVWTAPQGVIPFAHPCQ